MKVNFYFLEKTIGKNGSPTFTLPKVKVVLDEMEDFYYDDKALRNSSELRSADTSRVFYESKVLKVEVEGIQYKNFEDAVYDRIPHIESPTEDEFDLRNLEWRLVGDKASISYDTFKKQKGVVGFKMKLEIYYKEDGQGYGDTLDAVARYDFKDFLDYVDRLPVINEQSPLYCLQKREDTYVYTDTFPRGIKKELEYIDIENQVKFRPSFKHGGDKFEKASKSMKPLYYEMDGNLTLYDGIIYGIEGEEVGPDKFRFYIDAYACFKVVGLRGYDWPKLVDATEELASALRIKTRNTFKTSDGTLFRLLK